MKPRIKSMIWNIWKQKTTNQNNKKNKRIQKKEYNRSTFWDNFKRFNIHIIGVPEGEEREQEIGNLFENIMKENFPSLVKEKTCKSRKHRESQTRWMQTDPHQDTSELKCQSLKIKRESYKQQEKSS